MIPTIEDILKALSAGDMNVATAQRYIDTHIKLAAAPASPSVAQAEPSERAASLVASEPEPMFYGRWHHGNGNLCCGTMRYFRADFDTNPAPDVREGIFDWVCTTMNAALDRWREQKRAADRASEGEAQATLPSTPKAEGEQS